MSVDVRSEKKGDWYARVSLFFSSGLPSVADCDCVALLV